jgi:hypothetical protein
MRALAAMAVLLLAIATATPARAEGFRSLAAGVNGLLTFPADPILGVIFPPEKVEDMPGYVVTGRIYGLFGGTLLAGYRVMGAVYDIAFFPFWVIPTFSPPAKIGLIPGVETE